MLDDVNRAPGLVKDLEQRRAEKQKELTRSLRGAGTDVSAEIRSARKKSMQKVISQPGEEPSEEASIPEPIKEEAEPPLSGKLDHPNK